MRVKEGFKQDILTYILNKIDRGDGSIAKTTAENFNINTSTVHSYINELIDKGVIQKEKRATYSLTNKTYMYDISKEEGSFDIDTIAYSEYLEPLLTDFPSNVKSIWNYALSEMFNNVIDHSGASNASITIKQNYLTTSVQLYDDGIGIFNKIKDYFGYATIDDAICELFKGKLTTDKEHHSGEGIFFSSKMVDEFYIISGHKIFTSNIYDNEEIITLADLGVEGTCVVMKLHNFTKKRPRDIFASFSDIDGGFTKTVIPMKNIFDGAPVSRSQAKRVASRLERFKEVVFDFEGIEWMGQGFAHELFVLFGNNHMEISIEPINMTEEVESMYAHVMMTV